MPDQLTPYEYQDSGVEWLGAAPAHWEVMAIKRLVSVPVTDGPHETPTFIDDGVPFLSAEGVSSGVIDFNSVRGFISEALDAEYSKKYSPLRNDIFMVKSGATTGVTAIVETDMHFNIWSPLAVIRCNAETDPYYTHFFLRSRNFQEAVELNWSFGTQQNIGMGVIENLHVARPPLDEARQIAKFLDYETGKIDALIEKQQQLIALLKEKRQAVISHAVTKGLNPNAPMRDSGIEWLGKVPAHWEVGALCYALNAVGDVDHYMPPSVENGVPYVMTGDLEELASEIDFARCKQVAHHDYFQLCKKIKTTEGDLIMARYATIGTVSYVDLNAEFLVSYSCVTIKPNIERALGRYLFFCLKSDSFVQGIQERINTNTQGNVGIADLRKVKVALPSIEEQLRIAEYLRARVAEMDKILDRSESAIELLHERRTALISAAVTGKIDVRGWKAPESQTESEVA